jgi:lipoprotein-releasing system permease protein
MPFELFVAVRYLLARRRQAFISLISLISVIGVGVGVMALLIALALMTGLQAELRDRIVGSAAHIYVFRIGGMDVTALDDEVNRFLDLPRVQGAAPVIIGKALIQSAKGEAFIDVKGILPERERTVTQLQPSMRSGTAESLERAADEVPAILLGTDLARALDVVPGETVELHFPHGTVTPFGVLHRPRTFAVTGLFNLGLFEFDSSYGFVHLDVAARMLPDQPPLIELRVDDMFRVEEVVRTIAARFGAEYTAQHWADLNRSLFSALWLEKVAISITIGLIVMVAALNIIASLILLVMEKSRDIAILKTMGSTSASIRRIFVLQGLIIGLVGTAAGALAGTLLIYVLDRYRLISVPMDVYQISYVPFTLELSDFLIVILSAIVICFVATIYPSRQAARLDPAQALRYQ